jgi:hypothetical protein
MLTSKDSCNKMEFVIQLNIYWGAGSIRLRGNYDTRACALFRPINLIWVMPAKGVRVFLSYTPLPRIAFIVFHFKSLN